MSLTTCVFVLGYWVFSRLRYPVQADWRSESKVQLVLQRNADISTSTKKASATRQSGKASASADPFSRRRPCAGHGRSNPGPFGLE
jgi:hypothetical protein